MSKFKKLDGMITTEYRQRIPLEQDLLVGILLVIYMGYDIPKGEKGSGLKWCLVPNPKRDGNHCMYGYKGHGQTNTERAPPTGYSLGGVRSETPEMDATGQDKGGGILAQNDGKRR